MSKPREDRPVFCVSPAAEGKLVLTVVLTDASLKAEDMQWPNCIPIDLSRLGLPICVLLSKTDTYGNAVAGIEDMVSKLGVALDDRRRDDFSIPGLKTDG